MNTKIARVNRVLDWQRCFWLQVITSHPFSSKPRSPPKNGDQVEDAASPPDGCGILLDLPEAHSLLLNMPLLTFVGDPLGRLASSSTASGGTACVSAFSAS